MARTEPIQPGVLAPDFQLPTAGGGAVLRLSNILQGGPAFLLFIRATT